MAVHFYKVKVKDIRKETEECVSVAFDIPQALQDTFKYTHGQYITLRSFINGEDVRRSYSLCSSPLENEWRVAIKKVDGGLFSTYANNQLKPGDEIELMPPMGNFTSTLDKTRSKKYIAFAAGSGITPVLSVIKTILATEPLSHVTLIYGNRNRHSIIFKEAIEGLKNKYIDRFRVIHILSREITDAAINCGRIDKEKCHLLFTNFANISADEFFICGPQEMIFCIKDFLKEKGIPDNKIHFELFTTREDISAKKQHSTITKPGEPQSKVTIKHDGIAFDFNLDYDGEDILDAALHHGVDLPYSCKSGVCCTCKARLEEGQVSMDANYGLEPEEIEAGYILCCQSHPVTEKVVIDFDIK